MGISGVQSSVHSFSCRRRAAQQNFLLLLQSLLLLSALFSFKAAHTELMLRVARPHTCGEVTVRAARVGAGAGRGGGRRRCRRHRGAVDELEGGGGRVADERAEAVDVRVGRGREGALPVRAAQVHPRG